MKFPRARILGIILLQPKIF